MSQRGNIFHIFQERLLICRYSSRVLPQGFPVPRLPTWEGADWKHLRQTLPSPTCVLLPSVVQGLAPNLIGSLETKTAILPGANLEAEENSFLN